MIELLSPAGDEEKMRVAFNYGADAVYFGGQNYSLRANAKNFNKEEITLELVTRQHAPRQLFYGLGLVSLRGEGGYYMKAHTQQL